MLKRVISLFICTLTLVFAAADFAAAASLAIDETLETPLANVISNSSLGVSQRIANTPDEFLFSLKDGSDTKEYILLKSVNANQNDGFFIMTNGYTEKGAAFNTTPYGITSDDKKGTKTADSVLYDTDKSGSIAARLNSDDYINEHFPLMKDYINTHTWYTEKGYQLEAYKTECKIALLSLTEYKQNADRIGYLPNGEQMQWWLRSPHQNVTNYAVWEFLANGEIANSYNLNSTYQNRVVRPCFYLNEDFFKNVKLDTNAMGEEVKKTIRESLTLEEAEKLYSKMELNDMGYDIHSVGFSNVRLEKNDEKLNFKAFSTNHTRAEQPFTLIASVYKDSRLEKINKTEYQLAESEEKKLVSVSVDLSELNNTASDVTVKIFAFLDFKTLIPVSNVVMDGNMEALLNSEFENYEKVEICIPEAYQNLYNQKDAYFDVSFIYAGKNQKEYTISYSIDNWTTQTDEKVTLSYITNIKRRVSMKDIPIGEHTLKVKVSASDGVKAQKENAFSVIRFYEEKPLDKYYDVGIGEVFDWYTHPKEYIKLLKNVGFINIRTTPSWNVTERTKGKIEFTEDSASQKNLETFAENGLNISTFTAAFGNKNYTTEPEDTERIDMYPPIEREHIDAYANYASSIPSILKTKDGKSLSVKRFEIWNEPNLDTYWGYGTKVPDPIEYIYMMNRTAARIRKDHPDAIIAGGALAAGDPNTFNDHQEYLNKMYDSGMLKYVDEYTIHPYMYPKNPDTGYRSDGMFASLANDYVYNLTSRYLAPRKAHGGWIDVAISEVGWSTYIDKANANKDGYGEYGRYGTSESDQAIYLVKTLVYDDYLGLSHTEIFTSHDRGTDKYYVEHNFGIIRNDYSLKKAVFSLSQYNNVCSSAQYIGRVKISDNVFGYVYENLTKPFMIVWKIKNDANTEPDFEYTLPSGAYAEDMIGNKADGEKLQIGTEPVYIYNIPTSIVKQAFADLSLDKFKNFYSYSEYKTKLDAFLALSDMPDAKTFLSAMEDIYSFGKAVIGEKKSNPSIMNDNDFMYALFEVYEASKQMAAAYVIYDAEYASSNSDVASADEKILKKKNNQKESSLYFTDAIMRYAKRYNKIANEVKNLSDFEGKNGFAAMNDYLAKNLCDWAMLIMDSEQADISRAILSYAKSKLEINTNNSYALTFTLDNMLTVPFSASVYIADENGALKGDRASVNVDANSYSTMTLIGNSVSASGEYTYYIFVEYNGKVILKQPFVLTVK